MRLAAPLIIAAHVETLPTLPGWDGVTVFEGAATDRGGLREYVTIGYVPDADSTLTLTPTPTAQNANREAGTILSQLLTRADTIAAARTRVFDLLASWATWLDRDHSMTGTSGQARLLPSSDTRLDVDVLLATTRSGATASAVVTITYTADVYG